MIGQENLLYDLEGLEQFPRFSIIAGAPGGGKKMIAKKISRQLNIPITFCDLKVDTVREVIETAHRQNDPIIFCFPDAEKMSIAAKNALLKITEEPPRNAYFIITINSLSNIPDTLQSRGMVFHLNPYTKKELMDFGKGISGIKEDDLELISEIAEVPGEVLILADYDIKKFNSFIKLVVDNIGVVNGANAFKIADNIKFKDGGDGWDIIPFLRGIIKIYHDKIKETPDINNFKSILITLKYISQLQVPSISKGPTFDMWILELRGVWR